MNKINGTIWYLFRSEVRKTRNFPTHSEEINGYIHFSIKTTKKQICRNRKIVSNFLMVGYNLIIYKSGLSYESYQIVQGCIDFMLR